MKKLAIALGLLGGLMLAIPTGQQAFAQKSFVQDFGRIMPWNAGKGNLPEKKKAKKAAKKKAAKKAPAKKMDKKK